MTNQPTSHKVDLRLVAEQKASAGINDVSTKEITKQSGNIFVGSRGTSQISVLIVLESQLGGLPARPIDIM